MSHNVQETTTVQHSLPSEGADELLLAGVNDVNLKALADGYALAAAASSSVIVES